MYPLPTSDTWHGNVIVSPATNLKVSDLDIKLGSALNPIWLIALTKNKIDQIMLIKVHSKQNISFKILCSKEHFRIYI